ncbi:hypothetical protein ARMGADRAFT_680747 [Armillaria gallica]|uniref:Uncharacterized protein n=1 Tax=Armillaria gallica TaxID=47427 RepID=A0A2H3D2B5_ARMGA|nr:hypothetical protein ARMGADRAFT_680747 [Armillaria gallica]
MKTVQRIYFMLSSMAPWDERDSGLGEPECVAVSSEVHPRKASRWFTPNNACATLHRYEVTATMLRHIRTQLPEDTLTLQGNHSTQVASPIYYKVAPALAHKTPLPDSRGQTSRTQ